MEDGPTASGDLLAHYRLVERIGEGGMGVVYKAWDTRLERHVALKLLRRDVLQHEHSRSRLRREALVASSLNHPYIATIHDLMRVDDQDLIAMELVEGETLKQRLLSGPLELREALDIALAVADALGEAHRAGVVHRDIKPDNIMLTPRGYPKIMDFGLAKVQPTHGTGSGSGGTTELTADGAVLGTVAYMSPEQAAGKEATAVADVFSFGLVLYEMLTRRPAFSGDSDVDILYGILHHQPRTIADLNPNVPAGLQSVVLRCLSKEPEDRFPDAAAVHDELRQARDRLDVQRTRTLGTLAAVSREMTSILDLEPLLERMATLVKSLIDYEVLGVFRFDEESKRLIWLGGWGYEADHARQTEYSAELGLCGRAIRSRNAVRVGDVRRDDDYYPPEEEAFVSSLVVPLIHKDRVIAVLNMESRKEHFFTGDDERVLSALAGPIASAIANADLFAERESQARAMEMLLEIGREVSSILDLDALLDRVGLLSREVIDYEMFAIFLLDPEKGEFEWRTAIGYDPDFVRDRKLRFGEGIISRAVQQREPVIVADADADPQYIVASAASGRPGRSELAVPLIAQERVLGVMTLESAESAHFSVEHADLMTVLASQVAVAIENARLYGSIQDRAKAREREADRIRQRFESYVTPHIAEQVFRDPNGKTLGGERRLATVLVADIRGFTPAADALPAQHAVRFLQEFFSVASHVVFKYEGTVDKFLGDALMAFYGAPVAHDPRYGPSDPQRAVFAALDLRDTFRKLRDKWWEQDDRFGGLELSVGINTGTCLLGNMGSDKRVEYTAIGQAVNQAFRLCTEAGPGEIRIGGLTREDVHEDVRVEPIKTDRSGTNLRAHRVVGLKYMP